MDYLTRVALVTADMADVLYKMNMANRGKMDEEALKTLLEGWYQTITGRRIPDWLGAKDV